MAPVARVSSSPIRVFLPDGRELTDTLLWNEGRAKVFQGVSPENPMTVSLFPDDGDAESADESDDKSRRTRSSTLTNLVLTLEISLRIALVLKALVTLVACSSCTLLQHSYLYSASWAAQGLLLTRGF